MTVPYTGRVLWALTKAEMTANAAYRAQILMGTFGWVVPLVMLVLWRASTDDAAAEAAITTYYLATLLLTVANPMGWVPFGLGDYIRTGQMASLLLRPSNPIWTLTARALGRLPLALASTATTAVLVTRWIDTSFTFTPATILVSLLSFVIGMAGVGMVLSMFGMIAFWTTKGEGIQSLGYASEWLFGGLIAPFAFVDGWFGRFGNHQPYWLGLGAPAELLSGLRRPSEIIGPLASGLVWILILWPLCRRMWDRGARRHEAVGS